MTTSLPLRITPGSDVFLLYFCKSTGLAYHGSSLTSDVVFCCYSAIRILLHLGPFPASYYLNLLSLTPSVTSLINSVSQPNTFQARLCPSGRTYLLDISEIIRV